MRAAARRLTAKGYAHSSGMRVCEMPHQVPRLIIIRAGLLQRQQHHEKLGAPALRGRSAGSSERRRGLGRVALGDNCYDATLARMSDTMHKLDAARTQRLGWPWTRIQGLQRACFERVLREEHAAVARP